MNFSYLRYLNCKTSFKGRELLQNLDKVFFGLYYLIFKSLMNFSWSRSEPSLTKGRALSFMNFKPKFYFCILGEMTATSAGAKLALAPCTRTEEEEGDPYLLLLPFHRYIRDLSPSSRIHPWRANSALIAVCLYISTSSLSRNTRTETDKIINHSVSRVLLLLHLSKS